MLINDLTSAFRQGKALTNSATWANTATATGALSAVLVGGFHIAKAFGYDFGADDAQLTQIAGGIAALVLLVTNVLHTVSNPAAGVPTKGESEPAANTIASRGEG